MRSGLCCVSQACLCADRLMVQSLNRPRPVGTMASSHGIRLHSPAHLRDTVSVLFLLPLLLPPRTARSAHSKVEFEALFSGTGPATTQLRTPPPSTNPCQPASSMSSSLASRDSRFIGCRPRPARPFAAELSATTITQVACAEPASSWPRREQLE